MKEYIDKKLLINTYCEENCGNRKCVDAFDKCIFISHILEQPVADVKEVIHAKWIDTQPDYSNGYHKNAHKCSNCGDYYTTEPEDLFFCPRCGAKMDL